MKDSTRNKVLPLFIGILLFAIELAIALRFHSIRILLVYPAINVVAAYCLLKFYGRFDVCGWFQIGIGGSLMVCLLSMVVLFPKTPLDYIAMYLFILNWLVITGASVILKFAIPKGKFPGFKRFFRLSSLVFGLFYATILLYALFFKAIAISEATNGYNLVPFSTILSYMNGIAHLHSGVALMNLLANIFLFIPLGFYIGVLRRNRKMIFNLMLIVLIPFIVELIQFVFSLGILDVDDVILNAAGGFLGILLFMTVEKLYCMVRKDPAARLFLI